MKIQNIVTVLLITFISVSCLPAAKVVSTETVIPAATLSAVTLTYTTMPGFTKIERWMEYEHALALEILGISDAICEWDVLGQNKEEIYVWAMCQITDLEIGSAASVPAVIYLGKNGSIEKVQIPGDGTQYGTDIREMFPSELHERIFEKLVETDKMWSHIQLRQKNPEPPLIVLSGISLP